jgi:hypothetical protein
LSAGGRNCSDSSYYGLTGIGCQGKKVNVTVTLRSILCLNPKRLHLLILHFQLSSPALAEDHVRVGMPLNVTAATGPNRSKRRLIVITIGMILSAMSREELYRLIDTLPEAALKHAQGILDHLQTWPPQPPPEIDRIRRQMQERMHQVARPGFAMAGGSSGSYMLGAGGHVRNGHHSFGYPENGAEVRETHHFHEGLEITITERMRLGENGKTLIYGNAIVGPDGERHTQDITFSLGSNEAPSS